MNNILTIFKKELIDTVRDRRTLIAMVLIPLLLFPVLITISSKVMMSQVKKAQEETVKIGIICNGNAQEFRQTLLDKEDFIIIEDLDVDAGCSLIKEDSIDALIVFDKEFDKKVAGLLPGKIDMYFKSTDKTDIKKNRVFKLLKDFKAKLRTLRLKELNIDEQVIEAVQITERNLASSKEKMAEAIGGFLPYLFIIFCFTGSMYPAIDLAAGEKERGTLETLLTSPVSRIQILIGKFGVVVLSGILSAMVALLGLYIGFKQVTAIPPELMQTILGILELKSVVLLFSLLLPLTIFFAAVLLSLSIYARSFKEAQSIITPLMVIVIIPAAIGMMPFITLNFTTALIPVLNVPLATKGIIAGTIKPLFLAEVYISSLIVAAISLWICNKIFQRESVIFR